MSTANRPDGPPIEILVAEDSVTQAKRLEYLLKQQGYAVIVAKNGREALEHVQKRKPALIISDVVMPEMDGYDLCRSIKTNPQYSDVPVILVTTMSDPHDVIRGLECRADNFILKPYDERYLMGRLQYVLVNREMRQSEQPGMGLEIFFNGQRHFITADRLQILNLLLSTYDAAMQRNRELNTTQTQLREANAQLQGLTTDLERRVTDRTEELANSNRSLQEEIGVRQQAELKLKSQLIRLDLLSRITRAISERQDLRSIFQVLVRRLEEDMPVDFACVCLKEKEGDRFQVSCLGTRAAIVSRDVPLTDKSGLEVEANGLDRCLRGEVVYEPEVGNMTQPFLHRLARGGLHAVVAAPLLVDGRLFGIIVAARRAAQSFSSGECEFLRQLSEHVALASKQAELLGALQQAYDDLRQTQQAIMQQERLRALGQMASGIAHDINNAISPVALYTESLLEKEPGLSARARNYLETIQHAIDDVAQTVSRMREFYRQREPQLAMTPVVLSRLAQQVLELTRVRWNDMAQEKGGMIHLHTEWLPNLPAMEGVESELRDALTNLVLNAVDAMSGEGILTLRTGTMRWLPDSPDPKSAVYIEVTDTGVGMDEDTRRRCLEPFFTTKGERGTGLGLAMVYGTVQRHGARIEIDSTPGHGTTMRLVFPVTAAPVAPATGVVNAPVTTNPLRLLIIDDDPLLIRSLRDALTEEGHFVTAADGGQAGIDAFLGAQGKPESFEAVITDLGMPYVDGRKVAEAIKTASPATPVLMLTGWGQRLVADGEVPPNVDQVLSKPPRLRELKEALARVVKPAS